MSTTKGEGNIVGKQADGGFKKAESQTATPMSTTKGEGNIVGKQADGGFKKAESQTAAPMSIANGVAKSPDRVKE